MRLLPDECDHGNAVVETFRSAVYSRVPLVRGVARRSRRVVPALCGVFLAALMIVSVVPNCFAASSSPSSSPSSSSRLIATDSITDTENLLGSNVSSVTDAISRTKKSTGVSVRLLYLSSFNSKVSAEKWASDLLRSTDPQPNTVLLAVASSDGSLVVAVSPNSDEWLSRKSTVDALSSAALKPLNTDNDPDWSGSAIAMMNEIVTAKKTSTNSRASTIGVAIFGGVLAILLIVVVAGVVRRRRRRGGRHQGGQRGRRDHRPAQRTSRPAGAVPGDGRRRRHARRGAPSESRHPIVDEDSVGIQETSRERSDAKNHEQTN